MRNSLVLITCLCLFLAACESKPQTSPAPVVEQYLVAKVEGDADTIRQLLCSEMEAEWQREVRTFETITGATIQDLECQRRGDLEVVQCQGQIVAAYGTEQRLFPLGAYRVTYEHGEWKWCGETQ